MSGNTIPDDVRARMRALFGPKQLTPAEVKAKTLAPPPDRPSGTTFALLAKIKAEHPELFDYALQLVKTRPAGVPDIPNRSAAETEIRTAMAAVRIVSYRREIAKLAIYLDDNPTDAVARQRVADLTAAARDVERRFPTAGQRAARELSRDR